MSINKPKENPELVINWRQELQTGTAAAIQQSGLTMVVGSDWDRRTNPKTDELAKKMHGQLTVIDEQIKNYELPSRANTIIPLPNEKAFIGCHNGEYYIVQTSKGKESSIAGQSSAGGITQATYSTNRDKILAATTTGKISVINAQTAREEAKLPFGQNNIRLSTVKLDQAEKTIFAGDYDGNVYELFSHTKKTNLKTHPESIPQLSPTEKPIGPSISAIEFLSNGNLIVATRWNQLYILSPGLSVLRVIEFGESITSLTLLDDQNILAGTRFGGLVHCELSSEPAPNIVKAKTICQEPPSLQPENSVLNITKQGDQILATFADGVVYSLSFN